MVDGELVLVLLRPSRGEVRLPKGHVEPGETVQEAARREVAEESGYTDIELIHPLGVQVVEFTLPRDRGDLTIARTEHYFLFRLVGPARRRRDDGDLKFDPAWRHRDEVVDALTFPPEKEWARRALDALSAG